MRCKQCGREIPSGGKFCKYCGAACAAGKDDMSDAARRVEKARAVDAEERRQKRLRTGLIAASGVLFLAVAAVGVLLFSMHGDTKTPDVGENSDLVAAPSELEGSVRDGTVKFDPNQSPTNPAAEQESSVDYAEDIGSSYSREIIEDFQYSYAIYQQWIQGRSSKKTETISQKDPVSGQTVKDGSSYQSLLESAFSTRYAASCMKYLGVSASDKTLSLPEATGTPYDVLQLSPSYAVARLGNTSCKLKLTWTVNSTLYEASLDGSYQGERWVFDDLSSELAAGSWGIFGSYRQPAAKATAKVTAKATATPKPSAKATAKATPTPTPTPDASSGNTTVAAYKYVANVTYSVILRSAPDADDSNEICEIPLGTKVGFIENTDSTFAKVKYNGNYGYVMRKYLSDFDPTQVTTSNNTTVVSDKYVANVAISAYFLQKPISSENYVIAEVPVGTKVGFIENADNGFARVKYNGSYGYIKQSYLSDTAPSSATAAPSTPTNSDSVYKTVVQDTIDTASENDDNNFSRGMLCDVDGNGTDELILLYPKTSMDLVMSVYTIQNGAAVCIVDRAAVGTLAGGPDLFAGVATYQGKTYVVAAEDTGETGPGAENLWGEYRLYTVSGGKASLDVDMSYQNDIDEDGNITDSTCTINGSDASYEDFMDEISVTRSIRYGMIDETDDGMDLSDLLAKVS